MKRKDVELDKIRSIMAHPQVLKQCQKTLKIKYACQNLISGKGDLIDTAKAAWALANGKIASNTFILGPKNLAKLYDLEIVAGNLQDSQENWTTFFLVKR
jgi:prephenate dehydratase